MVCELRPWGGRLDPKHPSLILLNFFKSVQNLLQFLKVSFLDVKTSFSFGKRSGTLHTKLLYALCQTVDTNVSAGLHCVYMVSVMPKVSVKFVCAV